MVEADRRLVEEFMRDLDAKIAEEQDRARSDVARMTSKIHSLEDDIRERWAQCQWAIEPMRQQREAIAKNLAATQGPLPVVFIPVNQST